jgi:hypothetical protein
MRAVLEISKAEKCATFFKSALHRECLIGGRRLGNFCAGGKEQAGPMQFLGELTQMGYDRTFDKQKEGR